MSARLKRFWISWYQPTEDYRPIKFPIPVEWWCSGERADGASTLCAMVDALTEEAAKKEIQKYWHEAGEWRFCDEKAIDWLPGSRFPVARKKSESPTKAS